MVWACLCPVCISASIYDFEVVKRDVCGALSHNRRTAELNDQILYGRYLFVHLFGFILCVGESHKLVFANRKSGGSNRERALQKCYTLQIFPNFLVPMLVCPIHIMDLMSFSFFLISQDAANLEGDSNMTEICILLLAVLCTSIVSG